MRTRCVQCVRELLAKHPDAPSMTLATVLAKAAVVVYNGESLCREHLEERLV